MKVIKQNEHSLMLKPFMAREKQRMAVGVLVYFDLNDPQRMLQEQDLWKEIPEALPQNMPLDEGMPKANAEFLVVGSCFAPRGTKKQGLQVKVRVGQKTKLLDVLGDRHWKSNLGIISDPVPFGEIPLTWNNAYGGKDFPRNPQGKGAPFKNKESGAADQQLMPLPNVENPSQLIGAMVDSPEPVGLLPYDPTWPQRAQKARHLRPELGGHALARVSAGHGFHLFQYGALGPAYDGLFPRGRIH